jgi:hypothetical protein
MTQFPMNNNTPNGQTHTIMESPIWMVRLHSYWITFAITWFSMFWVAIHFSQDLPAGLRMIFALALPLSCSVYFDEYFTQTFFKRDWEESKKMDALSIRGIPIPAIREYIEFQISLRKKFILFSTTTYALLTFWSTNFKYVSILFLMLILSLFLGAMIRVKLGLDKFGFNSLYFRDINMFKSYKP